jgi:hypothetical protein
MNNTTWQVIASGIILYDGDNEIVAFATYNLRYPQALHLGGRVDLVADGQIVASSDPTTDRRASVRLHAMLDARRRVQHKGDA